MGFDQDPVLIVYDPDSDDVDGPNRRGRVRQGAFAFGELEPEVVDVLGPGLDPPRGERIGAQSRLEPIGERLRGGEVAVVVVEGHCG